MSTPNKSITTRWFKLRENASTTKIHSRSMQMNTLHSRIHQTRSSNHCARAIIPGWASWILNCSREAKYPNCKSPSVSFSSPRINKNIMCCKALKYRPVSSVMKIFWTNPSPKRGGRSIHLVPGAECRSRYMVKRCSRSIRTCRPRLWHPTKEIAICKNSRKTIP